MRLNLIGKRETLTVGKKKLAKYLLFFQVVPIGNKGDPKGLFGLWKWVRSGPLPSTSICLFLESELVD